MDRFIQNNKLPIKVLIFGLYASICHLCGILLLVSFESETLSKELLTHTYAPMIEYSAMSILLSVIGCALLELTLARSA